MNINNKSKEFTELIVQVAVGSLSKPSEIAAVVNVLNTVDVILWASTYKSARVREVAAKKALLPFGRLLRMLFFDKSTLVRKAAKNNIDKNHKTNLKQLFYIVENFPQLSLPFTVNEIDSKDLINEIPEVLEIPEIPEIPENLKNAKTINHKLLVNSWTSLDPGSGVIYLDDDDDDDLPF